MGTRSASFAPAPEMRLLLACARSQPTAGDRRRWQQMLQEPLSWDKLLLQAGRHRLVPLLDQCLQGAEPGIVPLSVQNALTARRHAAEMRTVVMAEAIHSLLAQFRAAGVDAIPYKGPVFAAQVYGDPALRPCSDLDFLVPEAQVSPVKTLLLAQGYQSQHQFADAEEEAARLRTDCEYNFIRSSDRLLVEIHWRFRPESFPFPIDREALWSRRQTILLGGLPVSALSLEDSLLLLCVHGAKHCWERLLWVCDIAEIVRAAPALHWEEMTARAETLGCQRILLLGLLLARDLLDAPVPDAVLAGVPRTVTALAGQIVRQLCGLGGGLPEALFRPLFHLSVRERQQDRLPYWQDRLRQQAHRAGQTLSTQLSITSRSAERR